MNDTSKYLSLFVSEATEHAEQLVRHGPALLAGSFQTDLIDELFRHAHSLRGMSAAMGFEELVALARATEQLLGEMRGRQVRLSTSSAGMLGQAGMLLHDMIRARGDGGVTPGDPRLLSGLAEATFEPKTDSSVVDR